MDKLELVCESRPPRTLSVDVIERGLYLRNVRPGKPEEEDDYNGSKTITVEGEVDGRKITITLELTKNGKRGKLTWEEGEEDGKEVLLVVYFVSEDA